MVDPDRVAKAKAIKSEHKALGVVCFGEHGSCGHGKDLGDLVGDVAHSRGSEPAALREDEVGYHLQGR